MNAQSEFDGTGWRLAWQPEETRYPEQAAVVVKRGGESEAGYVQKVGIRLG